jgi:hypothetical protein
MREVGSCRGRKRGSVGDRGHDEFGVVLICLDRERQ